MLDVGDGQRTERVAFVDQVNGMRVGLPRLGCSSCAMADANAVEVGVLLMVSSYYGGGGERDSRAPSDGVRKMRRPG